jgi:3-isopropylmalate dehydrogenase
VHGSAPDIAGQDVANPMAAILSAAMLLDHSLDAPAAAGAIRDAVSSVLAAGHRSRDLVLEGEDRPVTGCVAMGDLVLEQLEAAV